MAIEISVKRNPNLTYKSVSSKLRTMLVDGKVYRYSFNGRKLLVLFMRLSVLYRLIWSCLLDARKKKKDEVIIIVKALYTKSLLYYLRASHNT
jgi:hypothetical protein